MVPLCNTKTRKCKQTQNCLKLFMKMISILLLYLLSFIYNANLCYSNDTEQCNAVNEGQESCSEQNADMPDASEPAALKYTKFANIIPSKVQAALASYTPCTMDDCSCYADVIENDLAPYRTSTGVTHQMLVAAANYGTRYKIHNKRLYRDQNCMFPARCLGIEYFLFKLLPVLPNMDLVINTRDWPQINAAWHSQSGPVFSFSKTKEYSDIMYPAWTFWAGGPAISLHPTGIGRWDLMRESIRSAAEKFPWSEKQAIGFFRGSRTSDERDTIIFLSRKQPNLIDAQYTKNQAWKSLRDTLNAPPAEEVSFEDHCKYKYLFNFRGVAASFRLKHLFLCKSLVFHVGDEWQEFFYGQLKPWVHYVPLKSYPSEQEMEELLRFFHQNDELAKQIAERGYEFIWQHLRMQDIKCYWRKLLKSYAKLLKYDIELDNDLIEIIPTSSKN